jgi:hypothetical protein
MRARTLHTDGEQRTVAIVLSTGDEAMACLKAFAESEHVTASAVHCDRGIRRCNLGISLYIGSSNMVSTYGAAGALIIVLVWVYYSAQILLLGAEFAKAYSDRRQALDEARQTAQAVA